MEIIKLTFLESPGLNDHYIRSYDTDLKNGMIDDALRHVSGETSYGLTTIGRIASNMVRPMGHAGKAYIDGGWGRQRMRFAMLVEVQGGRYHQTHLYITGYTDDARFAENRDGRFTIDPDMRMYFNSVTEVALMMSQRDGREARRPRVTAHDQILSKRSIDTRDTAALLRPSDLFRRHANADMGEIAARRVGVHDTTRNLVGSFSQNLTLSTRRNNSPTSYLQRSVDTYLRSSEAVDDHDVAGWGSDQDGILDEAASRLKENILSANQFFDKSLGDETNYFRQGYITYGELIRLNPDFDEDDLVGIRPLRDRDRSQYETSSSNRSDTPENMAREILRGAIPAIMLECMYSRVEKLIIDTGAMYEEDRVIPAVAFPFVDGLDTRSTDSLFIDRILQTVVPDISRNGAFQVEAEITCDIDGHIEMYISIDGGPEEFFADAVYADALKSAVLTNSLDNLERISEDILTVCSTFQQDRSRRHPREIFNDRPARGETEVNW